MKIRTKLHIAFLGIAILLSACLISIVYFSMVPHFEKQVGEQLKEKVRQSAKEIDDFMLTRVKDFNILSNNPLFSTSSNNTISDYLSRVVEQYPFYEHISFVNKDGIILASSSPEELGLKLIDFEPEIEEEFQKTLNGGNDDVYISDKALMKEVKENAHLDIELLSNVIDLNGNVIGVLLGIVDFDFIRDIVNDIDERTIGDEYAYLVDDPGNVIFSANPDISSLEPHPDLSIKNLQQKLEGDKNGFDIYQNSKGIKVISGYADLSEYGTNKVGDWSLLSTAPYGEIMIPIYVMIYKVIIAFLIILVGIFLLTFKFSHAFSKPIIQLQQSVSEFDMDSKPLELKIDTKDEIGDLSASFNNMSKNIYQSSIERKQIKKLLHESKDQLDNIINNIGDPVFVKDEQSQFLLVNDACCKVFNLTRTEIIGKTLTEDIPPYEMEGFLRIDKQVLTTGVENISEESLTIRQGETRLISTKKTRYIDENGTKFLIGVVRDITERKQAEIELENHKNNLEDLIESRTSELEKEKIKAQSADLMKSAFLATMSHELRTPMNSIIGFTGILLKEFAGPINEEQEKQLLMVKNSGQHLLGLINDILDISKIEAGKLKVSRLPFNYLSTIEKTVKFLLPQANKKGLQINSEFSDMKVILNSDERRVEQVLLNLISNAIKFSNQGTILVKVAIDNNFVTTQIIDQGIGISKEDLHKLFMPFIQVKGGLTRRHEGTGLGLAICKNLIEKLGGTIQVTSKKGEGSDFLFKLPIEHTDNK